MSKYQSLNKEIEAIQWIGDVPGAESPEWYNEAIGQGKIIFGNNPENGAPEATIINDQRRLYLCRQDFIIFDNGDIWGIPKQFFNNYYQKVTLTTQSNV